MGTVQGNDTVGAHHAEAPPLRFPTPDVTFPNPSNSP